MQLFVSLLVIIVPGFIADMFFQFAFSHRIRRWFEKLVGALMFDLLITTVNFLGLVYIKNYAGVEKLIHSFNFLSFIAQYAILSIILAIVLGLIFGFIFRFLKCFHHAFIDEK